MYRKFLINSKKAFAIYAYIVFEFICIIVLNSINQINDFKQWVFSAAILIVIDFVVFLFVSKRFNVRFLSLPFLFITFSYLFNFGQVILYGLVRPNYDWICYITMYPASTYKPAILLCYVINFSVIIGMMISRINYQRPVIVITNNKEDKKTCRLLAIFFMCICFPLEAVLDISKIFMLLVGGYDATYTIVGYDGISTIASFYFIGFVLLLYTCKDKNRFKVYVFELLFLAVIMLSGNRAKPAVNICVLSYFYLLLRSGKKIKKSTIAFIAVLAYLGMILLATISNFRGKSIIDIQAISDSLGLVMQKKTPINAFLYEFGSSVYTSIATYDYTIMSGKYAHGYTFLLSWVYALPNVGGLVNQITSNLNYCNIILDYGLRSQFLQIGGAYTGEMIYNFHYLFPLFSVLLGIFISNIDKKIEKHLSNNNFIGVIYYIMAFTGIVFYVRGVFFTFIRQWAWSVALIYIITELIKGKNILNKS